MGEISRLGRYELRRILGKGAMGVVYEGFDPSLNRRVAVKTILKSLVTDEETAAGYSARFAREAKAVARLNHPHIVQVYDFGEENDVAYLVMEFIQGRELRSSFEENESFGAAEAVRIMGELLAALEFAHEAGVIHRDVKPANVMLDAQRRVKLADFGVARIQDGTDRSKGGTMVGTPAFMSPEQISGRKVDRRTDLFSAGVILYQLLTGERPFKGEGAWTVAKQIMQEEPPRPSTIAGKVSPAFDQIVNRALAKKPEHRFASAREFSASLQAAYSSSPAASGTQDRQDSGMHGSDLELEFWRSIQNSDDPAEFEAYLKAFPQGAYAELARIRQARLPAGKPVPRGAEAELAEETARLEQELARREAEYRKREAEAEGRRQAEEKAHAEADARRQAEAKTQAAAEEKARLAAVEKARQETLAELAGREAEYRKRELEALATADAEAAARRETEEKVRRGAEDRAKTEAEARASREAEEKARRDAESAALAEAEARTRREADEFGRRQAAMQQREAELNMLAAQVLRRKAPMVRIVVAFLVVVAGAIGAWYWTTSRDEARLAELTAALEAATRASRDLDQAKHRAEDLRRQVETAKLAEDDARAKGEQSKLKELQEQTKKTEVEAQKQNELVRQREAEAKKAEDAAKVVEARKQTDSTKAMERAAQEKAALEKAAQEKAAQEKAAQERSTQEKAAAEKVAVAKPLANTATGKVAAAPASTAVLLEQFIARHGRWMVVKQDPLPKSLAPGEIIYVDDGKCSEGTIKELTGGNLGTGLGRQSRCVKLTE